MGTTADKLNKILDTKSNIKSAINSKGVTVEDTDTFASYADKINDYLVYPTNDTAITTTDSYDVTLSKTAQVSDTNLVGDNIRSTVKVLGVQGTLVVNRVYSSASAPTDSQGNDGDIWIQTYT